MIYYSVVSEHTHTASPQPYFLATYGEKITLHHSDELGFSVPDWPDRLGDQPSQATLLAWIPPTSEEPEPVTDAERAVLGAIANFKQARLAAPEALDRLKGTVWAGLVASGLAPDEATAAGVGLVLLHGPLLAAFEAAGGHPKAAEALYAAIASPESVAALPWLKPEILAIFATALTPGP